MSLEAILSERENRLSNIEKDKSEIADIDLKMSAISDEQLSPLEKEIEKKQNELENVLICVVRYFGGIKLGAGLLTRSYLNSTKEVIKKVD